MEWKKLYNKTFHGSFFRENPPMMKALWAVLITEASDEGIVDIGRAAALLRGSSSVPATTQLMVMIASLASQQMVSLFESNGIKYVRLLNWSSYQQFQKSTDRKIDRKIDGVAPPRAAPGGAGVAPLKQGEEFRGQSFVRDYFSRIRENAGNGSGASGNGGSGSHGGSGAVGLTGGENGANPASQEIISDNNGNYE